MIVIGADVHKSTHALAAVDANTGQLLGEKEIPAKEQGHLDALRWAHELDTEIVWAIEDCRDLSHHLENAQSSSSATCATSSVCTSPEMLAETGCGPLTAAILIGQTAGAQRFKSDAHFARLAGVAPIPVSSGRTDRHRLDRGGNRQLNRALHVIAITRGRLDPGTRAYLQRKEAEGKTRIEAMRCLKRHLARRYYRLLGEGSREGGYEILTA
jgi:transposase